MGIVSPIFHIPNFPIFTIFRGGQGLVEGLIIYAGQMLTLLNLGCSPWSQPMKKPVNPLGGEPPTGEPCAGEPHARFGGGRDQVTGSSYPYQKT